MDTLIFMLAPMTAAIIFLSLHVYTGMHILARGVIFVDLALAQIATIGIGLAMAAGGEPTSPIAYILAFAFTVVGATLFAWMRKIPERIVPHEALIGISYVVASAVLILVLANSAHGTEEMKALLVGTILWISWQDILLTLGVYLALGFAHWLLRKRFLEVSFGGGSSTREIWSDFLFYLLFGTMITFSVRLAGVLLVFSFLIIPSVMSAFWATRLRSRLPLAWGLGLVGSVLGMLVSFKLDFPTGATIVVVLGLMLNLVLAGFFWKQLGSGVRVRT